MRVLRQCSISEMEMEGMSVDELGDWLIDKGFSIDTVKAFAGISTTKP